MPRFGVEISVGVNQSDLGQSIAAYKRLGLSAEDALKRTEGLANASVKGGEQMRDAAVKSAAAFERFQKSIEAGGGGSERALLKLNLRVEQLRQEILAAQKAGSPVAPDALATLRALEAQTEDNVRALGRLKAEQNDVADAVRDSRNAFDGQGRQINDLGSLFDVAGGKVGKFGLNVLAVYGSFKAGMQIGEDLRSGLDAIAKELFDVEGASTKLLRMLPGLIQAETLLARVFVGGAQSAREEAEAIDRLEQARARYRQAREGKTIPHGPGDPFADQGVSEEEWVAIARLEQQALERRKRAAEELARRRIAEEKRVADAAIREAERVADRIRKLLADASVKLQIEEVDFNAWVGIDIEKLQADIEAWKKLTADAAAQAQQDFDAHRDDQAAARMQEMAALGVEIQRAFEGVEGTLGKIGRALGVAVEQMAQAETAAERWAAGLEAIYAVVRDNNVTEGGFGGEGEGNRAAEGQMIGAIVGAIIGAFAGGNVAAGAAIGSAAGGIIGSFIKKGAQEAMAVIALDQQELVTLIRKSEGGLGSVLTEVGQRLNDALLGILDTLGGTMDSIPAISMKVRDGVISVWVGAVVSRVQSMDEAITFAVTEILKQGEIAGLSETIRTVLENTAAIDLDQLARDLDFGLWYERLGLEDAAIAIEDAFAQFRTRLRMATQLGLDEAPIGEWLAAQLQGLRDQLLGVQMDPAEALRRNVEAFNQQVQLTEAEQLARRADLLVKKAQLEAEIALLMAEMQVGRNHIDARRAMVEGEAYLVEAEWGTVNALLGALQAVDAALVSADLILANLPDLIGEGELQDALDRLTRGGGRGRGRADSRGDIRDEVEGFGLGDVGRELRDAGQWFDDFKERIREAGFSAAEAAGLIAEAEAELARRTEEVRQRLMERVEDFLAQGTPAGGPLMSAMRDSERGVEGMVDELRELHKAGELSWRDFRALRDALREAGEAAREGMVGQASNQLLLDLYSYLGDDVAAAELKHQMALAEFKIRRAELELAMRTYGMLDEGLLGALDDLILRIEAAGAPGAAGGGGGAGSGASPPPQAGTEVGQRRQYNGRWWRWNGTAWVDDGPVAGGNEGGGGAGSGQSSRDRAQALFDRYQSEGQSPWERARQQLESDFALIRQELGDTAEVATLYADAMARLREEFLGGLRDYFDELTNFGASQSTGQQFAAAGARAEELYAAVAGGDLSQADALRDAIERYEQLAQGMFGTSTGGYQDVLGEILGWRDALGLGPTSATAAGSNVINAASAFTAGSADQVRATDNVATVIDMQARQRDGLLRELAALQRENNELLRELAEAQGAGSDDIAIGDSPRPFPRRRR